MSSKLYMRGVIMGLFDFENKSSYEYPKSIKEVDDMGSKEFEIFIYRYFTEYEGYEGDLTPENDYGLDIILSKSDTGDRYGIQCKRYGANTTIEENKLSKMLRGVRSHNVSKTDNGYYKLILFTTGTKDQLSNRAADYILENKIKCYFREDVVSILKNLDKELNREVRDSNYVNIAFDKVKKKQGSYKQSADFVNMLKKERLAIAKFHKLGPAYKVLNDKTLEEIVNKVPRNHSDLKKIVGFKDEKIKLFGTYLLNRIRNFYNEDSIDDPFKEKDSSEVDSEIISFLKEERKKIAKYNNIDPLYLVFNNATLEELAVKKPSNKKEFVLVKGLSEEKYNLFGEYLIRKISEIK